MNGSRATSQTEAMLAHQAAARERVVVVLGKAMDEIEAEIRARGSYPRRLTRKELCRRAGVGESTLKNPSHTDTRRTVDQWLAAMKRVRPTKKAAQPATSERTSTAAQAVKAIALQLDIAKRRICELEDAARDADRRCKELEAHVRSLSDRRAA